MVNDLCWLLGLVYLTASSRLFGFLMETVAVLNGPDTDTLELNYVLVEVTIRLSDTFVFLSFSWFVQHHHIFRC